MVGSKAKTGPAKTGLVNIADVARAAGVSVSTVSRSLNGSAQISEKTRRHVEQVAQSIGYVPNSNAKALTTASNTVILVVRYISGGPYMNLIAGVEEEASGRGLSFRLITPGERDMRFNGIIRQLQEQRPRVAIILSSGADERLWDEQMSSQISKLREFGTELIIAGRAREPMWGDAGVVDYDNKGGMRALVERLIEQGHRRFVYCGKRLDSRVFRDRYQGFLDALSAAGMERDHDAALDVDRAPGDAAGLESLVRRWRDDLGRFAVVASTDDDASAVMLALYRCGIAMPGEASVSGFDDMQYADRLLRPLTTVHVPFNEMGHAAVRMGLGEMKRDVCFPVEPVIRESTAV
ncbi:LacI family transcriptional regulator [Bifidobacterium amazonense]|uniref:LacI family transcriptional regulator n=1 Tax=Bifidobacterium amazonense TaxID=2809027 RepID=A0ABS9VV56_9BIFI|nr:LacI family DNA-binding transcriptional regulator [Bifidobacterium amazonense]MCH9275980.1 LacI family transcriptional regulator [Bifidobacterium amazonense]